MEVGQIVYFIGYNNKIEEAVVTTKVTKHSLVDGNEKIDDTIYLDNEPHQHNHAKLYTTKEEAVRSLMCHYRKNIFELEELIADLKRFLD
jgi:hypothetical protein